MDFEYSDKVKGLRTRVERFMQDEVYPNEEEMFAQIATNRDRWQPIPLMEKLKAKARSAGLWNLFLPESEYGAGHQPRIRTHLRGDGPLSVRS